MELNATNFFTHLIFNPFEAKSNKDKAIALVASVACAIFSVGLIHLGCAGYYLYNRVTHKTPENQSDVDINVTQKAVNTIGVGEATPINSLNNLLSGTEYTADDIPEYQTNVENLSVLSEMHNTDKEYPTSHIMQGTLKDGRPFVVMKVYCQLTEKNADRLAGEFKPISAEEETPAEKETIFKKFYNKSRSAPDRVDEYKARLKKFHDAARNKTIIERLLVVYPRMPDDPSSDWNQSTAYLQPDYPTPIFKNLKYYDKEGFIQKLLKKEKFDDTRGISWALLPEEGLENTFISDLFNETHETPQ